MRAAFESVRKNDSQNLGPAHSRHSRPLPETIHPIFSLQKQAGNQAVQRLLHRAPVQAKLAISSPGGPQEHEANLVANRVMRMSAGSTAGERAFGPMPGLQRKCSCGGTCDKCREQDHGHEEPNVQMKADGAANSAGLEAPPIVHQVLRSPGQPLGAAERAFMEPRFGRDFSGVRIHTDAKAAESAAAVQARAYTVGQNIVLGGRESTSNLPVLAHELAHVVQQGGTAPVLQRLGYCADFLERFPRPGVGEHSVRDSLADDAALFGPVETELVIPAGSAAPWRTEPRPGKSDKVIPPQKIGGKAGKGQADVGLLRGSTLEVLEVKEATWYGGLFAENQLSNYLSKAEDNPDLVNANWRARGNARDEIKTITAMPMTRLNLQPNPRLIDGVPVALRWCDDGIVVFKVEQREEEKKKEEKKKEEGPKKGESGPGDTLPEQLLKMGGELGTALAADGLLSLALDLATSMGAIVASPLVALAALVLGVVYFWDDLKRLGRKIVALAQWVWGKYMWVVKKIEELGIKLAELVSWLGDKIPWLAGKFVAGAKWAAGKVVKGAEWVGGKIASGAEAVWDWLFGSRPQPTVPTIDLPVTETTTHCATVAHEDAIVKIGADLLFPFDEWKLKPEADAPLKEAAVRIHFMLRQSDEKVIISGYTDKVGSEDYNKDLSERRAGAVKDWFVQHGVVPLPIIQVKGFGKTQARYDDPAGRATERRVEIWVTKHGSVEKVCSDQ
jgi:outer membrane protein OmpA-like peptidoglycan-associated protein